MRKPIDFRTHEKPCGSAVYPLAMLVTLSNGSIFKWIGKARDWPHAVRLVKSELVTASAAELWDWCSVPIIAETVIEAQRSAPRTAVGSTLYFAQVKA